MLKLAEARQASGALRHSPDAAFGAALRAEAGLAPLQAPASPRLPVTAPVQMLRPDEINLGVVDTGGFCGLDLSRLFEGRLLIQGASGAGKSWTLRRLLEQTVGRVQQIVIDPEGEFQSLAETYGHLVVDASSLDTAALAHAAARAREHRVSLILDLSDLDRERQMMAVAAFFSALIEAPREQWFPVLVVVDEVHLLAPFGGQTSGAPAVRKAAIDAVTDLMSRGRKRGLCGVLATQRLARLSKSVVSEAQNFLIGLNTLDLDIRRAAETIGWDARRAFDRLPILEPGNFVAVGSAFTRTPAVTHIGPVTTKHRGETPIVGRTALIGGDTAAALLGLDALRQATAADAGVRADTALTPGLRVVRAFVREEGCSTALLIWDALKPLVPNGARLSQIADHLARPRHAVDLGLELLDRLGLVEFTGDGDDRIVRLGRGALL